MRVRCSLMQPIDEIAFRFYSYLELYAVQLATLYISDDLHFYSGHSSANAMSNALNFVWVLALFTIFILEEKTRVLMTKSWFLTRFSSLKIAHNEGNL